MTVASHQVEDHLFWGKLTPPDTMYQRKKRTISRIFHFILLMVIQDKVKVNNNFIQSSPPLIKNTKETEFVRIIFSPSWLTLFVHNP